MTDSGTERKLLQSRPTGSGRDQREFGMNWQPFAELQKGETVGFVLNLIPGVRVVAVYYQPDGVWYSALHIRRQRFSNHVKSTNEADAKARAIEQAAAFHNELTAALVGLGTRELS